MFNIFIKINRSKDRWNWYDACNSIGYGMDWKMSIEKKLRDRIYNKTFNESKDFLKRHLEKIYEETDIFKYKNKIQKEFDKRKSDIVKTMERITGKPIYRNNITCFITSFPRYPYDFESGCLYIAHDRDIDRQVAIFIHELLHFQYFAYLEKRVLKFLSPEQSDSLKEAMTVILNEEFKNITSCRDKGYEMHKKLRIKLLSLWKKTKNMNRFIDGAIKIMQK